MNFLKKLGYFITHPTSSRTAGILLILVIAASVPLTVFIAQKQQELRQRAVGNETTACTLETYEIKGCTGQFTSIDLSQFPRRMPDSDLIGKCLNESGQISEEGNAIWRECPPTPALFPTPTLPSTPIPSSTPYSVYGTVFYDNNGNGLYDSGDALYRGTGGNSGLYLMISDNDWSSVSQNGFYTSSKEYPSGSTISLTLRNASNLPSSCSVRDSQTISVSSDAINWPIVCETPISFVTPIPPTSLPTLTPSPTPVPNCGTLTCLDFQTCIGNPSDNDTICLTKNTGGIGSYCGKPSFGADTPNNDACSSRYCESKPEPTRLYCAAKPSQASGQSTVPISTLTPSSTAQQSPAVPPATTTAPGGTTTSLAADVNQNGCISLADFNEWLYAYLHDGTPRKDNYKPNIDGIDGVNLLDYNAWYTAMKSGKNLCEQ